MTIKLESLNFKVCKTMALVVVSAISLQLLLMYFQLHLNNFKTPKSLAILETIFS